MRVEFELNTDVNGRPCIKFRHHDKDDSLEQRVLKIFLDAAKEKGLKIVSPSGFLEVGTNKSYNNYEIRIGD